MRGQSDKVVAIIVTRLDSCQKISPFKPCCQRSMNKVTTNHDGKSVFPAISCRTFGGAERRNIDGVVLFGFTGITEEM